MGNYEFAKRQNESGLQMGVYHKVQTRWKHRKVQGKTCVERLYKDLWD